MAWPASHTLSQGDNPVSTNGAVHFVVPYCGDLIATCVLEVASKMLSFSFHPCQCCLHTPKGIFRKQIPQVTESKTDIIT